MLRVMNVRVSEVQLEESNVGRSREQGRQARDVILVPDGNPQLDLTRPCRVARVANVFRQVGRGSGPGDRAYQRAAERALRPAQPRGVDDAASRERAEGRS